jgi:hypothetical protein
MGDFRANSDEIVTNIRWSDLFRRASRNVMGLNLDASPCVLSGSIPFFSRLWRFIFLMPEVAPADAIQTFFFALRIQL